MSHQCIADAFAPAEARYREQVYQATWGHLTPERNKVYSGRVTFAIGCYDALNPLILDCNFPGMEDSPWFFDALTDLIEQDVKYNTSKGDVYKWKIGGVYRWEGIFRNYEWSGSFTKLKVTETTK